MFYSVVVQAVLLFGSESCAMTKAMTMMVERTRVSFLRYIIGKRERINTDVMWETPASGEELRAAVMQTEATYIGHR